VILNIGCGGSAKFTNPCDIWGDVNADQVKPTRKIPNFVLCDAHYLPFKQNVFDTVLLLEVLEHLTNPIQALQQIRSVLCTHGRLILSTPNSLFILKILQAIKRGFYVVARGHIYIWGQFELHQLLRKCGFNSIHIRYSSYRGQHTSIKWIERLALRIPCKALKNRTLIAVACMLKLLSHINRELT